MARVIAVLIGAGLASLAAITLQHQAAAPASTKPAAALSAPSVSVPQAIVPNPAVTEKEAVVQQSDPVQQPRPAQAAPQAPPVTNVCTAPRAGGVMHPMCKTGGTLPTGT